MLRLLRTLSWRHAQRHRLNFLQMFNGDERMNQVRRPCLQVQELVTDLLGRDALTVECRR